jgi:hypothetical protein
MVLGIIGALIGFGGAFFALYMGSIDSAFNGSSQLNGLGTSAFLFSGDWFDRCDRREIQSKARWLDHAH